MSSSAIATLVKIMESLPETLQDRVVEHLREYLEDLRDEEQWNFSFQNTQESLIRAAKPAKQEISEGKAQPLDIDIALEIPTIANYPSRREFMQLSLEERRKILAKQAEVMLQHYHEDREWQELEAGDLIDY
ncbi:MULTISPECIES: hypothetical protein [unclassified Microcoleus]|uniref:hypothetical protein n=1 Tax=unclassified Microcoleus TaxID=2642155 RepID=UPI0025E1D892|nr:MULTISPECIES: hypothetical protein [unclassified Microcoleus]